MGFSLMIEVARTGWWSSIPRQAWHSSSGWAQKSTQLGMICVEGNSFSDGLKASFHNLRDKHPGLLVVVYGQSSS